MSAEDFQLIDETVFDNSILKRDFSKQYHQRVNLYFSGEDIDFSFGGNSNYYQVANAYLEFD